MLCHIYFHISATTNSTYTGYSNTPVYKQQQNTNTLSRAYTSAKAQQSPLIQSSLTQYQIQDIKIC